MFWTRLQCDSTAGGWGHLPGQVGGAGPMRSQTRPDPTVLVLIECGLARRKVSQSICALGAHVCVPGCRLLLFRTTSPHSQKKKSRQNQLNPRTVKSSPKLSSGKAVGCEPQGLCWSVFGGSGSCSAAGVIQLAKKPVSIRKSGCFWEYTHLLYFSYSRG